MSEQPEDPSGGAVPNDAVAVPPRPWTFLGMPIHQRIRTGQRHIPWSSVFILSLIWFTFGFHIFAGGLSLTFTLQRYTNDPRILAFVRTINIFIVLGPFISYISDQVWTRMGRRRPFMIIAWAASCVAMMCFAFLPQVAGFINGALGVVGIPPIAEVILLVAIIAGYTTLADLQAPLEPLFLECVPPHQRGRFFAVRGVLFSLAVLFFFQVLWPVYDHEVNWLGWWAGQFTGNDVRIGMLRGEQLIYIFASALFFLTGAFLLFNIRETRVPTAPNKNLRELFLGAPHREPVRPFDAAPISEDTAARVPKVPAPPAPGSVGLMGRLRRIPIVGFAIGYLKDVFFTWGNYPFYIVLVIPGIEQAVWGDFGNIMQDKQFGYTKANQALWGFPMQIFTIVALIPFAGWYADTRKVIGSVTRQLIFLVGLGLLTASFWAYERLAPADVRELPALGVGDVPAALIDALPGWAEVVVLEYGPVFLLAGLVAFGCMALFIWIVETMLSFVGREHTKAWVALLAILLGLGVNVCLYVAIQASPGKVVPITLWMMLNVANGAFGALLGTFVGPMIYEYMPRSKMGTINAGRGLMGDWLRAAVMNLGGVWIVWYSARTIYAGQELPPVEQRQFDYTSMYLIQFVLYVPAILATVWFLRQILTGRILKWGVMEVEGEASDGQEPMKTSTAP